MSGNVWEWVWDWYGTYPSTSQTDPRGPTSGSYRVLRGGSFSSNGYVCRVAYRFSDDPSDRYFYGVGFRSTRTQ
jgi:formylglycine-generating enzyme required for sulfatase activity